MNTKTTDLDFSHITERYSPTERVWFPLGIEGGAELRLCYAGSTNKPYIRAVSAEAMRGEVVASSGDRDKINSVGLEIDRRVFPLHVVTDWKGVRLASGEEAAYSTEACAAFLRALPQHLMEKLSRFAGRPENFAPGLPTAQEVEATAGN